MDTVSTVHIAFMLGVACGMVPFVVLAFWDYGARDKSQRHTNEKPGSVRDRLHPDDVR